MEESLTRHLICTQLCALNAGEPSVGWIQSERGKISSYMLLFSKYNPVTSEETSDKQTQYFAKNEECRETVFTEPNL